jgi:hypothetical protein
MSQQQQYHQQEPSSLQQQGDGQGMDSLYKPLLGLFELVDRILDKGLVIDVYLSITVIGIPLVVIRARIVVASIDTFLRYADAMGLRGEPGDKIENRAPPSPQLQQFLKEKYEQQQNQQQQYQQQQIPPQQQQGYNYPQQQYGMAS